MGFANQVTYIAEPGNLKMSAPRAFCINACTSTYVCMSFVSSNKKEEKSCCPVGPGHV